MKVQEIMSKKVSYINVSTTVAEAAAKMKEFDIGALPVAEGEKFKGMLTDRDIAVRCGAWRLAEIQSLLPLVTL